MHPARSRPWTPLLEGDDAAHAHRILDDIAAALADAADDVPFTLDDLAGRAVFYAYLSATRGDASAGALVDRHLDRAVDALAQADTDAGLWTGFAGVAWAAEHVRGRFCDDDDEDLNADIDAALAEILAPASWPGDYDLIRGLAGYGVYAIERLGRASGRALLAQIVTRLASRAEERDDGRAWHTASNLLPEWQRAQFPRGYYNLGVAHGVPGVLPVLAAAAGTGSAEARALGDGVMRFVAAHGAAAQLPALLDGASIATSRHAWCYGDAGAAASLLAAARAVDEPAWAELALTIGRRVVERERQCASAELVEDAGLCHGAAGLALVHHRLWSATGDGRFADCARRWYAHVIAQHRPGRGLAGFQSYKYVSGSDPSTGAPTWCDDATLLTGITGIGLVLLAGVGAVEPAWDRALALSLPPR